MGQKKEYNKWKTGTYVLLAIIILMIVITIYQENKSIEDFASPESICSRIKATPSWADINGNIIDTGYKNLTGLTYDELNILIEKNIRFVYHPGCKYCQKQMLEFGYFWNDYQDSGLTIDCSKLN
ncbi:MAG TPA: hypothetical protein ENG87_04010 [Candidatus Pacearchaeota archaeon]|nr:hypothetical protein [Candidatus Pacearchaeota archaeon]HDZ61196.1 hypothetical protein [Candidatus Pacearchaeota archaeon]